MNHPTHPVSDAALHHLRAVVEAPDLTGTRYELEDPLAAREAAHAVEPLGPLGRGGMGTVYRAFDRTLERDVALKVLRAPAPEGFAARLLQEAKILARLEHPGIVPVHDVGTLADGRVYYAMKLVRGRRLDELVRAGMTEAEKLRVFARIGEAVAFAHAHGVIHRDLKPGNVMVGEFGEVLVLDWGVAKLFPEPSPASPSAALPSNRDQGSAGGSGLEQSPVGERAEGVTRHGTALGTPGYMSPEQERGDLVAVDPRSDVHALGGVLWFLLTGDHPPAAGTRLVLAGRQPKPLFAIAAKALSRDVDGRYRDAQALLADIDRFQTGEAVSALPEGFPQKLARFHRKHRAAIWLIGTYVVLRGLFALMEFKGKVGRV